MFRTFLLLFSASCIATSSQAATVHFTHLDRVAAALPGGPPVIRIADKTKITRVEWTTITAVELAGCVADARVTSMTVGIKDCTGKDAVLTTASGNFSKEMKTMIANLPDGTTFTVKVEVKDGSGKSWPVPDAVYTLVRLVPVVPCTDGYAIRTASRGRRPAPVL